jgi:hypothetical protein
MLKGIVAAIEIDFVSDNFDADNGYECDDG